MLVQAWEDLGPAEAAILTRVAQRPKARGIDLAQRLTGLARRCNAGRDQPLTDPLLVLTSWFTGAGAGAIPALETFAAGLQQGKAAVKVALTLPYRSTQAEGRIHELKLIKRQMCGRATFGILRRRVLLAA
ncbi:MAG: transposase [Verrucomicrobia bacterium]|nr:transposase [Verrucomicrobiota bacterium]